MLDDIQKWQIEQLATNGGFSERFIASYVFKTPQSEVSAEQLHAVRYHRYEVKGVRLIDWRNGKTPLAQAHAKSAASRPAKAKAKKRKAG